MDYNYLNQAGNMAPDPRIANNQQSVATPNSSQRFLDPKYMSNVTWDQLMAAGQNGTLGQMGYSDIKYNPRTGKFDTPSMFNDHAVTLQSDGNGGIKPFAEPASNGWIQDHKKELWGAAGLAAAAFGGYGLLSGLGGSGAAAGAAASGAGAGGAGLLGGTSLAALTPEAVYAGGLGAAGSSVAGMGGAAGIGAAGGGLAAGAGSGLLGSIGSGVGAASKELGAISSLGGAAGGFGGQSNTSTTQQQIDPRMAPYIYGNATNPGILGYAKQMYENNPTGMNAQMREGLNNEWNAISDPRVKQGNDQIMNTGLGLLNQPIAGNPFTNGMGGHPQAQQMQQLPQFNPSSFTGLPAASQNGQNPFTLMQMGRSTIPVGIPYMNNPTQKLGG